MTTENQVALVISNALPLSPDATKNGPIAWIVDQPNPITPNMGIVGMFVRDDGVEIYSVSPDKKNCARSFIPMHWVLYVHAKRSFEVFQEEYNEAVAGGEYEDDEDEFEDEGPESAPTVPPPAPVPTEQPS